MEDGGKIDALGLPVSDVGALLQAVDAADHLVHGAEAKLGHDLSQILGHEEEEVDDVLGLPGKFLAQFGILRGDAHRAGVQVALAHHDAAHGNERRGGEAELFGAQQRGDGHVAAGLQLAVHLQAHAAAQVVEHQHLLRFGEAQFPGDAGVANRADRRSAGAAVVAADENHVGVSLGHAGGHRAHADFGNQLHGDARLGIRVLEVVNQLRDVFDRVDVVVRRRRNQAHAGNGVAHAGDHVVDLVAGQLAAFAGLGALRDFDLQVVGVDEIVGGDAEARRGHLLDGAAPRIAVGVGSVAGLVLAALAGVGFAADAVHGDGQRLVGFLADGAEGHGAGGEALDDLRRRARRPRSESAGPAGLRSSMPRSISRSRFCWFTMSANSAKVSGLRWRTACWSLLTVVGIQQVALAAHAILIFAADAQLGVRFIGGLQSELMLHRALRGPESPCPRPRCARRCR